MTTQSLLGHAALTMVPGTTIELFSGVSITLNALHLQCRRRSVDLTITFSRRVVFGVEDWLEYLNIPGRMRGPERILVENTDGGFNGQHILLPGEGEGSVEQRILVGLRSLGLYASLMAVSRARRANWIWLQMMRANECWVVSVSKCWQN